MASDFGRVKGNVQRMIDLGAPSADIDGYLQTEGLTATRFKDLVSSPTGGIGESLTGGVKRNISSIRTGLGALFGGNEAATEGLARQANITERPGGSLEEVKRKFREDGILSAAGEAVSQIPGVLAEQAPFIGEMIAGGKAGAMLPVPPQFRPFTALGGAALAPFISQAGSNVERQAQEQQAQGKPVDVSVGKAYAAALPQAALDVVGLKLGLGRFLGVNKNKLGTEAVEALAREKLIPSILKGTGKTALAEMPTEVTQQMLERAQAGLSLTDKEALDEYADAAYQAGLMSPLGGAARRMEVSDAVAKQEEEKNKKLTEIYAERQRQADIATEAQAQYAAATAAQKKIIDEQVKAGPNRPLIDIINEVTGVSTPKTKVTKAAVNYALNRPSGTRVTDPATGLERELTMGEYQAIQNPELFREEAKKVLALPAGKQAPLLSFPDGSVGTEKDAEDYIASLPEDSQIEARAKLFGYAPQQVEQIETPAPPVLGLPSYAGEKMISFPDGSLGTERDAQAYIESLPEAERVAARAKLFGYAPQDTATVINKTTLTSLVPTLKSSAGIYKRLAKLENIDSAEKLSILHSELDKLGDAHAVNEAKLKEIEDGYKQVNQQTKAAKRAVAAADRKAARDGIQGVGKPGGGGSAAAPGVGGIELGRVDATKPPVLESVDGTSGLNAPVEAALVEEVPNKYLALHQESRALEEQAQNLSRQSTDPEFEATNEQLLAMQEQIKQLRQQALDKRQEASRLPNNPNEVDATTILGQSQEAAPMLQEAKIDDAKSFTKALSKKGQTFAGAFGTEAGYNYTNPEGVEVTLKDLGDGIMVDFIGSKERGKGYASKELDRIIKLADKTDMPLGLRVDSESAVQGTDDTAGLTDQQLRQWYERKGFIFKRGSYYGYRPAPSEDVSQYVEKTTTASKDKIPEIENQLNSDWDSRTHSEIDSFMNQYSDKKLKPGYHIVPAYDEVLDQSFHDVFYYDGKNKPLRVDNVQEVYDYQSGKSTIKLTSEEAAPTKPSKAKATPAAAPTQVPSPLAALVKSTLEAKEKDAKKDKKSLSKKAVDDRISNKEAISDHIDNTLTAEEENLVAEELGDGDYEAGKEKLVKLVAQSMAGKAISGVKLAIRNLVKKIQAGLMAMVISFNFNPNIPVIDVGVPIEVSAYTQQVDTQGKPMGEMAQKVAAHALNKGNGKAFIIADKPNEMLYAFNNNGVLLGKTVMLTGKGIGDVREKMNLSPWEVASEKQVTPAGTFTGKFKFNKHYGSIITLAETQDGDKTVIAIHKTPVFSKQAREAQLASPTIKDNRATQGCLNAPDKFYDEVIAPNFQGESQIYVMPDQSDAVSFFGIQETETKTVYGTTAEAESAQQAVGREEESAVPAEGRAPLKAPETNENIDAAIETAKAELGAAIRNTFAVAAMAVPESGGGMGNLLKALSNLMFLLIRKGVKSMAQAISMSRKAAGSAANKITPAQYRDAYAEAKARDAGAPALPASEQSLFDQTAEFVPPGIGKTDSVLDMVENFDTNRINGENVADFVTDTRINVVYSGAGIEDKLTKAYEGAVTNALTKEVRADILMSQALSANKIGAESAMVGKVVFDDNGVAKVVDDPNTLNSVFDILAGLSNMIGADKARHAAQAYLVALRYQSWLAMNKEKDKAIAAAKANKKYDLARRIEKQKKYVSEAQEAAIPAGLQFGNVYPEVKAIASAYDAAKNNEIDMLEQAGYYSKELAAEYRKTKGYVPLFRVMDDIEDSAPGAKQYFRGFADIGAEKKATGSERQVDDVFDNMMTRHMWAVNAAVRNRANRAAANQLGIIDSKGELILTDKPVEGAEKSSAPVWIDGERKYVQYSDPKFAVGIQGLEPALGPLMGFFAGASNILRMGVTILPPFQLAMVFHDAPRAALMSGVEHPYQLMGKVLTSFATILKDPNDPFVQEMRRLGISGGYGHTAAEVSAKLRRDLGLEANSLTRKALDKAEVFAAASDLAQRRAIYMQTMEETGNQVLAMHRALDIINFQKHGASAKVRALTQIVPFMNAYIQGMDVLYKAMSGKGISGKEKRQAQVLFMQTAIKLAALSALYSMLVADDDDYKRLDDREKVRSLIIPGTGIKIPVAADVAMLVKTIPELGYQYMVRSGTDNPMDATKLFKGVSDSFVDGLLGPNLTPQFLRTGVEVALNKNFMTGQPIVGRGLETLATSEQFTENTSRLARLIGQTGILSPMNADHLMRGYGGTAASLFLYSTDGLVNQVADVKTPTTPIYRVPSINAFFYSTQGKGQLNDYYDLKDRSDEVTATLNRYIKTGNLEDAQAYAAENQSMLGVRNVVNMLTNNVTSLREIRKQIIASDMDADEKRKRLDEIDTGLARMMNRIGFIREKAGL